jgi:hypothetical protein
VLVPSSGATLTGTAILDGSATLEPSLGTATAFKFELTGGSYSNQVVATAKPTIYGWIAQEPNGTWGWDSTSVPNGTYTLTPLVTYNINPGSATLPGTGITVTVSNPVPTAQVLVPSNGAILSGTTGLAGVASYPQNVTQFTYDLDGVPLGNAVPTLYGWLLNWDTTTVTGGSHTLTAVATYADGATATSQGISVIVFNGISIHPPF